MKYFTFLSLLIGLFVFRNPVYAQVRSPESIIRLVAANVMQNTSFTFIDTRNKKEYKSAKDIPEITADIKVKDIYNKWHYSNGVIHMGLLKAAEILKEQEYIDYVSRDLKFNFDNLPYFKKRYDEKSHVEWGIFAFHRMGLFDDYGAQAAAILDLNKAQKNNDYREYTTKAANYTLNDLPRLKDGTWCRKEPRKMTVWADDLYVGASFMVRMGAITGNKKYTNDAIRQVELFSRSLYSPYNGLYYHNWYSDVEMNGVAHWLRCNGWVAMAIADVINFLPNNHPKKKDLIAILLRQIVGFSRYQDGKTGLWHQLVDKPDSYLETSGTAMFTYAVAKAVNEGWIPKTYMKIADEGWKGVVSKIDQKGNVLDVCVGTGIQDDINFYYDRPTELNDYHAIGAVLLAGIEMYRASAQK